MNDIYHYMSYNFIPYINYLSQNYYWPVNKIITVQFIYLRIFGGSDCADGLFNVNHFYINILPYRQETEKRFGLLPVSSDIVPSGMVKSLSALPSNTPQRPTKK